MIPAPPVYHYYKLVRLWIIILGLSAIPSAVAQSSSEKKAPLNIEAAPDDPKTDLVELPRYVVTDSRILPMPESWRYSTLPGFEILSNARDFTTRAFLKDFQQLQSAIAVVWPTLTINKAGTPTILIFCARDNAFGQFIPDAEADVFITPTSMFVEDKERSAIVIDFTMQEAFDSMGPLDKPVGPIMAGDIEELIGDSSDETVSSDLPANDPYSQFYRQYSRFLMRRANNNIPIPSWLEEGLSQLFTTLDFRKKLIEFGKVENGFGRSSSFGDKRARFGHILSLDVMFNPDPAKLSESLWHIQWKKQCFAFAHMCLYGLDRKYQKPYINFARKACAGPVTEDDFKKYFNQSHKQMATRLSMHVSTLAQQSVRFEAKKGTTGLPDPLPVEIRDATQAEIGRIKGEVLRLAGHYNDSREALIVPYIRKERDAGLLASLGLLESLEHRDDRARKFLEAAAKENVVRPRAYVELARLRLAEVLTAPAGAMGTLSPAQTASVLEPLFKAREQPPLMEDVYELIGQTWLCSEVTPKEAHLGVLLEGTVQFPKNIKILEQAASLYTSSGDASTAATLIKLGLKISPDQETRAKFESLRARQKILTE